MLEVGQRIAAGVCGALLIRLGAVVVVAEQLGDNDRRLKNAFRGTLAAGKLSVGIQALETIVHETGAVSASFDVVVASSDVDPPGHPTFGAQGAIHCDITAVGPDTPSSRFLDESDMQALGGIISVTGLPGENPSRVGPTVVECLAGFNATISILAALRARRLGSAVDPVGITLLGSAANALSAYVASALGGGIVERLGNGHALAVPWNTYACADGWILICTGSDEQWRRLCGIMGQPELGSDPRFCTSGNRASYRAIIDGIVGGWTRQCTRDFCDHALSRAGVPCGKVLTGQTRQREANLSFRGTCLRRGAEVSGAGLEHDVGSPFGPGTLSIQHLRAASPPGSDLETVSSLMKRPAASTATGSTRLPLDGVRVLEIGHYTTAPMCGRLLGSLGADVVKVEPPGGEASRRWPPFLRGESLFYVLTNSDKSVVVLDLDDDGDRRRLETLASESDVLLENLRPGALAKKGFSYEHLRGANPRLVYCAISGFGALSAYPGRAAFDTIVQGLSGFMAPPEQVDMPPLKAGPSFGDILGAQAATIAVLGALEARERTRRGAYIDLSMQDILWWCTFSEWEKLGSDPNERSLLRCQDGFVLVEAGIPPDIATAAARQSRDEVVSRCISHGYHGVHVREVNELLAFYQELGHGLLGEVHDERGTWPVLAAPFANSPRLSIVRRPSPPLPEREEIPCPAPVARSSA